MAFEYLCYSVGRKIITYYPVEQNRPNRDEVVCFNSSELYARDHPDFGPVTESS